MTLFQEGNRVSNNKLIFPVALKTIIIKYSKYNFKQYIHIHDDEGFPGINYNSAITRNIVHVARYQCGQTYDSHQKRVDIGSISRKFSLTLPLLSLFILISAILINTHVMSH
jgi:hypothetical protein